MGKVLDRMEPLLVRMPTVKPPEGHVHFKNKLLWTVGVLLIYFLLTNIPVFGLADVSVDVFEYYRALLAGAQGTILHLGIGPIVTASIVLQLLRGADIIKINTSDLRGQVLYMGLQKILIFVMIILEALPNVFSGWMSPDPAVTAIFGGSTQIVMLLIFLQICIGGGLIMLMDEVVSKWGIGSGVGLFIVAGTAQGLVNGFFNWSSEGATDGFAAGFFPRLVEIIGSDQNFIDYFGLQLLALVTTVGLFFFIVYVESTRVEIPLAHANVRGARSRFPVKLIYASVLPMILVRVLQATVQMIGMILSSAGITFLGEFNGSTPQNGFMWFVAPINQPTDWMWWVTGFSGGNHAVWEICIRLGIDICVMIFGGALFAMFWVKTAGLDSKHVARQIQNSGMQIPGYRRSPAVLEQYLNRYIPRVTIIGGVFIGILSILANMLGIIGFIGGTGLLLTVSILYRLYEQVANEQMMEMYPFMRGFFNKE